MRPLPSLLKIIASCVLCFSIFTFIAAQPKPFRPPAVPLVTCDPYFSLWSFADHPASDWPRHWTGKVQAICSMVRVDGTAYRLVGSGPRESSVFPLLSTTVGPTRTVYEFAGNGVAVTLTFTTPLLPDSLASISRPFAYIDWQVRSTDGKAHGVALYFDHTAELVVNSPDQEVSWSRAHTERAEVLTMGSHEQAVLKRKGDDVRIDWGYSYLAAPRDVGVSSVLQSHRVARGAFLKDGKLPVADDLRMPRPAADEWPVAGVVYDLGKVSARPVGRFLVLAYDDRLSIEYFYRRLPAYWRSGGRVMTDVIDDAIRDEASTLDRCRTFDAELTADLISVGGKKYAQLAALAYRQAVAAQKLVADLDGTPLLFPKENFSNGCIGTVDVIYPAAPIFLILNVDMVKASLTPVLEYAGMARWRFPFAPHDLGTYPLANGQVYGGKETSEEDQMPVEECGNMLLLAAAVAQAEGRSEFVVRYLPTLGTWAQYLAEKGLDPENQLCTDDFAGHLAHNANLSLKAILALGAYAKICAIAGKQEEAVEYARRAADFARRWQQLADDGDHYRLAFDRPGTWSQKYNLVWDRLLDLRLFPPEVARKEIAFSKGKENAFGLPLDNRKDYTKLDWLVWTASLADDRKDFEEIVGRAYDFADSTPDRVPLTDWYDTKTAKQVGFQARSVVGGLFLPMLKDSTMWKKWRERAHH